MERKRNIQPDTDLRRAQSGAWRMATPVMADDERRASPRYAAQTQPRAEAVRLVDLSAHGCCLGFTHKADYRPGQFIRLGFQGESEGVRAIVRWAEGLRIGAEFTHGLTRDRIETILGQDRNPLVAPL